MTAAVSVAALLCAATGCGGGDESSNGKTQITVWEGYTDVEGDAFHQLVDEFNTSHDDIDVKVLETNNDYVLQKVLTAVRGGTPPDVAYLYGSWAPNVAKIPSVVDLTSTVESQAVNWDDFYPGSRAVTTVDDKVIGRPARVDNPAIVH